MFRGINTDNKGIWLINLLAICAKFVDSGNLENAMIILEQISQHASPNADDNVHRMVAYLNEALADRVLKAWNPRLHKALNTTKTISAVDMVFARKLFFDFFPFLRLAYVITNQAILEAMVGEKVVHIIDLHCCEPVQWINLLNQLRLRHAGPPHVRITGIHDQKEVLDQMTQRLNQAADKLDIPFQFHPIVRKLENLEIRDLRVKTGEAIAICSVLHLHSLLASDDDVDIARRRNSSDFSNNSHLIHLKKALQMKFQKTGNPSSTSSSLEFQSCLRKVSKAMKFLYALRDLSPKIMVITEQESNHNANNLMERIDEAVRFYTSMFECLQYTTKKPAIDHRQKVEKMVFGEEIKNIIASEGLERKERHEKLEKWIDRFEKAGFGRVYLSYNALKMAIRMMHDANYDGFEIKDENGCFFLCWHDNLLFSVSAWTFRSHK